MAAKNAVWKGLEKMLAQEQKEQVAGLCQSLIRDDKIYGRGASDMKGVLKAWRPAPSVRWSNRGYRICPENNFPGGFIRA